LNTAKAVEQIEKYEAYLNRSEEEQPIEMNQIPVINDAEREAVRGKFSMNETKRSNN